MNKSESIPHNSVSYRQAADLVRLSFHDRTPLILIGNPGIGKTTIVRSMISQLSADVGQPVGLRETLGYLYEPVDFRGLLVPSEKTQTTESFSLGRWPLKRMVDNKMLPERGILLLDEILNSHRDVLTAFAEPLCDHRVNGEELAPGWVIIGTGNHIGSGTSAIAMPSHVANRVSICQIEPDWNEWLVWATGRIRPELVGYFDLTKGIDLFAYDPTKLLPNRPYLTPRSLEMLSRRLDTWFKLHSSNPPLHVYSSIVGEYGAKLHATLEYIMELVPWQEIERNPTKCRIPSTPAAIYAQIQILAGNLKQMGKIGKRESAAAMSFLERFALEIQAAAMHRLNNTTEWRNTPEFVAWFTKNQHLLG